MSKSVLTHLAVLFVGLSLGSASLAIASGTKTSAVSAASANPFKCRYDGPSYSPSLADHVACLELAVFAKQRQLGFGKHLLGSLIDGRNALAGMCEHLYLAHLNGPAFAVDGSGGPLSDERQFDCPNLIKRGP